MTGERVAVHPAMVRPFVAAATAAAACLTLPLASAADAVERPAALVVTGHGGHGTVLTVGRAGLTLQAPSELHTPRLPGPDGTVAGLLIARAGSTRPVYGHVIVNLPQSDIPLVAQLVGGDRSDKVRLPSGRYVVALLGTGNTSASVRLVGSRQGAALRTTTGPETVTQTIQYSASPVGSAWSEVVSTRPDGGYVAWAGGGGPQNQAAYIDVCVSEGSTGCDGPPTQRGEAATFGVFLTPGSSSSSSWLTKVYAPGTFKGIARHQFAGESIGVGLTTVAHGWYGAELRR